MKKAPEFCLLRVADIGEADTFTIDEMLDFLERSNFYRKPKIEEIIGHVEDVKKVLTPFGSPQDFAVIAMDPTSYNEDMEWFFSCESHSGYSFYIVPKIASSDKKLPTRDVPPHLHFICVRK